MSQKFSAKIEGCFSSIKLILEVQFYGLAKINIFYIFFFVLFKNSC